MSDISLMASLPGMWARGAEICTLNLLTGLKERGYPRLYFHASLPKDLPFDVEMHLADKFREVANSAWNDVRTSDGKDDCLRHRLYDLEPDILLYAFDKSVPGLATVQTKTVLVVHGIAQNDFSCYHPEHTDAVVCVSQYATELAVTYGIPPEKLHCIPNGVPQIRQSSIPKAQLRHDMCGTDATWAWCFVGGLTRAKRPHLLIAAMARRQRKDECAIFAGVIDGGMRLQEYAEALGVEKQCYFLGHVDDIADVYNASDCLVITSERESMPLTMLEAMSAGLGVVANPVGGIPEVLNGKRFALQCDVTIESDFDCMLDVMRLSRLPQIIPCAMISDAKAVWKKEYSLEIMADNYDKLFRKLLGR